MSGRVIFCPLCNARYEVAHDVLADGGVLLCGTCKQATRLAAVDGEAAQHAIDTAPDARVALSDAMQPRVVVGHDVPGSARVVAAELRSAGFAPVLVRRGEHVLAACDHAMPTPAQCAVIDVGVPGVMAFEVIEQLRGQATTRTMPIVLLASVYEHTRYKRKATNLYGADAYLELHHVPDRLAQVVAALLARAPLPSERLQTPLERARAAGLRPRAPVDDPTAARALARRLLTDVALYHGDEVAQGVKAGDPFATLTLPMAAAQELFTAACDHIDVFVDERHQFAQRLLQRVVVATPAMAGL